MGAPHQHAFDVSGRGRAGHEHRVARLPETGLQNDSGQGIVWSPDSRYVAFTISLPIEGDYFPTPGPTAVPYTPEPTLTPVPLETEYDYRFPRTIVLDTETGYATIISTDIRSLILWTDNGGVQ